VNDLLFFGMPAVVVNHVALGPERSATALFVTDEGLDILMDPVMYLEVLLLAESLAAVGKLALEWLSPEVQMLVCSEADLVQEGLATAWELAREGLFGYTSVLVVIF